MQKIIVSDTSCLILLNKIGKLFLLKSLFGNVAINQIIANEFVDVLPDFIKIENPTDINYQRILESFLDKGEASAIALALEKENCLLIMDDLKGRREAQNLKINITGTLGLLVLAKEIGIIESVTEIINLINQTDFRLSSLLIEETKRLSNEK